MEYFDIVDENNVLTGERRLRSEVHTEGLWHRTVHVYIFRNLGDLEFLVHLRPKDKDQNPNKWDTRFGGHVQAGETIEETVHGELKDELNLKLDPPRLMSGETYRRDKFPNREFTHAYFYAYGGDLSDLKFNDGEVQEIKWMKANAILESMTNEPGSWTGNPSAFSEVLTFLNRKLA